VAVLRRRPHAARPDRQHRLGPRGLLWARRWAGRQRRPRHGPGERGGGGLAAQRLGLAGGLRESAGDAAGRVSSADDALWWQGVGGGHNNEAWVIDVAQRGWA